jgi:hypothetical protein
MISVKVPAVGGFEKSPEWMAHGKEGSKGSEISRYVSVTVSHSDCLQPMML